MTAPTPPTDAEWGVQWEVPVFPDGTLPPQPAQPDAPGDDPVWGEYNTAIAAWYAELVEMLQEHDEYWATTVSVFPNETLARGELVRIREVNQGNPFTRHIELAFAPPRTWTPVEA